MLMLMDVLTRCQNFNHRVIDYEIVVINGNGDELINCCNLDSLLKSYDLMILCKLAVDYFIIKRHILLFRVSTVSL